MLGTYYILIMAHLNIKINTTNGNIQHTNHFGLIARNYSSII